MRRKPIASKLMVLAALLGTMSLSKESAESARGFTASLLSPIWIAMTDAKLATSGWLSGSAGIDQHEELNRLILENQRLQTELKQLQELLPDNIPHDENVISAKVIYRSPTTWDSSLWVNVGSDTAKGMIGKNSPVVIGSSVVGVVDYVGAKQSRIRLITDSGLTPSVRVKREVDKSVKWLAKGLLQGGGRNAQTLHGTGFNYDFPDSEGSERDLRTGKPPKSTSKGMPLVKVGDLLVTTGMDGIFPPGLSVAHVIKLLPLKEGDYYIELEAKPAVESLNELSLVFILPPLGYDPLDQPPLYGW